MKKASIVEEPAGLVFQPEQLQTHRSLVLAGARRKKWAADERVDAIIHEAYRKLIEENDRKAIKAAAVEIGWPKHALIVRARDLGLSRVKEADWSVEEVEVLRLHAHLGPTAIQKRLADAGFPRTRTGVVQKRKRLDLVGTGDGYSAHALAGLMGIDDHTVTRWIERGWLAATRRETERTEQQGGDAYWIWRRDVRAFVMEHADEVDLRKVEKWWFLDLLTDGEIGR